MFPNARFQKSCPGVTKNLVVLHDGQTIFDRKGGDGYLNEKNAMKMMNRLKTAVENAEAKKGRMLNEGSDGNSL